MEKMPINKVVPIIIALIVVGGGAFYGGMKYAESKSSADNPASNFRDLQNLSPEERQKQIEQMGGGRTGAIRQLGGGVASGEIISKDDQSITVKLRDGGSKIVFYSDSTPIQKFIDGSSGDLEVGKTIIINGKANDDGTVAAQSIQIQSENIAP